MAYDETLAERIRKKLGHLPNVEEKKMMGGLTFMYNDKMCVGVYKDQLMCRIDPAQHEQAITRLGCKTMDFTTRPMIGFVLIDESGMKSPKDFDYWIGIALDYNKKAKSSKKKPKAGVKRHA
ncbi:MAG: TfoX/Sxy family protein [Bacteroidetes bacterium]|nr:TfoX/Sxy family protein [Bacteroidota bacterium]